MSQGRTRGLPSLGAAEIEIHEELGRGSFSRVYRCRRRGRDYAIKIQASPGEAAHRRHFLREAAALACFDDPGLAKIHTIGEQDGRAYLVMDLVQGTSLADVLRQGPLPEARIIELARRVARALHVAHRHGMVHCDVKPRNIIVGDTPEVKLVDFGLAARKQELREGRVVMGTYIYSAPEQTGLLRRTVDGRADLYALGVVMFTCASGRTPFVASAPDEMMRMHASVVPPDVRSLAPGISWGLSAVITKLLAKDPDDRFQTGIELVEALDALPALNTAAARGQPLRLDRHVRRFAGRDLDLPLIGRDDEMAAIERRWQRARGGEGSVVWMQGRPGSGKSRLLREVVARLDRGQARVFLVTCPQDRSGPFAPLRAVVSALHREISREVEAERRQAIAELRRAAGDRAGLLAKFSDLLRLYLDEGVAEATDDLLFGAVADFITALASRERPLVLMIDDVQWIDTASVQVLRRLLVCVEQHPILLVMGSRTEADAGSLLTPYDAGGVAMLRIHLNPLTVADVRALVGVLIGGPLRPRIVEQITSRTGGVPMAVCEYIRTLLDEGVLRPDWDGWKFDEERLDRLNLPGDILELMLQRVDGLDPETRTLLAAAAVLGVRFDARYLAAVGHATEEAVDRALWAGTQARVIGSVQQTRYAFVHERIHQAVLRRLHTRDLARLHRRAGEVLDAAVGDERPADDMLFAIGRHFGRGELRDPDRVFARLFEAAKRAANGHAYEDAYAFISRAREVAGESDRRLDRAFYVLLGEVCYRNGRTSEAEAAFREGLGCSKSALERAAIRAQLAEAKQAGFLLSEAMEEAELGFAELGVVPPGEDVRGMAQAAKALLLSSVPSQRKPPRELREEDGAERRQVLLRLFYVIDHVAFFGLRHNLMLQSMVRTDYYAAATAVPDLAQVRAHTNLAGMMSVIGREASFRSHVEIAKELAQKLGDRGAMARAIGYGGYGFDALDRPNTAIEWYRESMSMGERWLDLDALGNISLALIWHLFDRGYLDEALMWTDRVCPRFLASSGTGLSQTHVVILFASCVHAAKGRGGAALQLLARAKKIMRPFSGEVYIRASLLGCELLTLVETGQFDEMLDPLIDQFVALKINPARLPVSGRQGYFAAAFGLLQRAIQGHHHGAEFEQRKVGELLNLARKASTARIFSAQTAVLEAGYSWLSGDRQRAHEWLADAEMVAHQIDSPRVLCEAARLRAYLLSEEGQVLAAKREAGRALKLAQDHGMASRAAWIQEAFKLVDPQMPSPGLSPGSSLSGRTRVAVAASDPELILSRELARNWDILRDLSLSSVQAESPAEQQELVVMRVMDAFSAERGFLFLGDEVGQAPLFRVGRAADGTVLERPDDIARSVVDHVFRNQQPLLIRTDTVPHQAAFGAEAAINMRSVIAASLNLGDRTFGVLYLDRQLANGVFEPGEEQRLHAFASHAALALETARVAQLEHSVEEACRESGDLLETAALACGVAVLLVGPNGQPREVGSTLERLTAPWGSVAAWWSRVKKQLPTAWSFGANSVVRMVSIEVEHAEGARRFELTHTGATYPSGDRTASAVVVVDVSRRKYVEESLRARTVQSAEEREQLWAQSQTVSCELASFAGEVEAQLMRIQKLGEPAAIAAHLTQLQQMAAEQ